MVQQIPSYTIDDVLTDGLSKYILATKESANLI